MSRDDSVLYTGLNSASFRSQAVERDKKRMEAKEQRGKLTPAAELLSEAINKELARVNDINSLVINTESSEESLKAQLIARKLHAEFLSNFQTTVSNLLREPKEKTNG